MLVGSFFPRNPSTVVMSMYLGGVILSILSTFFLRRTVLKGDSMPFVMELPPYRLPTLKGVLWHVWEKTWGYMRKAGTVLLWVITTLPKPPDAELRAQALHTELQSANPGLDDTALAARVEPLLREYQLEYSIAGRIGKFISPALKPIGFDWKIGVALIPGLAAKELVVSTLGVLYGAPVNENGESPSLRETLRQSPDWSPRIDLALMVFVLVMPPCFASLATIRAEAGDKWMAFQVVYSIALAWLASFIVSLIAKAAGL
jgi:ferrous iron transport protein B